MARHRLGRPSPTTLPSQLHLSAADLPEVEDGATLTIGVPEVVAVISTSVICFVENIVRRRDMQGMSHAMAEKPIGGTSGASIAERMNEDRSGLTEIEKLIAVGENQRRRGLTRESRATQ